MYMHFFVGLLFISYWAYSGGYFRRGVKNLASTMVRYYITGALVYRYYTYNWITAHSVFYKDAFDRVRHAWCILVIL